MWVGGLPFLLRLLFAPALFFEALALFGCVLRFALRVVIRLYSCPHHFLRLVDGGQLIRIERGKFLFDRASLVPLDIARQAVRVPLKKSARDGGGRKLQREPTTSQAGFGCGDGTSLASFRRFWAAAARRNSSRAPFGPRSRSRSSLRMRLR